MDSHTKQEYSKKKNEYHENIPNLSALISWKDSQSILQH